MKEYFQQLTQFVANSTDLFPGIHGKIIVSGTIVVILVFIRSLIMRIVWSRVQDVHARYVWRKSLVYIFALIGLILLVNVWFKGMADLGTYFGLVSAGLAIALKDPVINVAGWLFIIMRRPFTLGDRIEINNHAGDVIDIRVFQFTLMEIRNWVDADQSTGRVIHVPNGKVFTETLANFSKGFQFIWNEIPVLVTFESNWQKAKKLLEEIANEVAMHLSQEAERKVMEASKKFMIYYR